MTRSDPPGEQDASRGRDDADVPDERDDADVSHERDRTDVPDGQDNADGEDWANESVETLVTACHDRLVATAERPVPRQANSRLGEATAVVADLADGAPEPVVARRIGHVRRLLGEIEPTGDATADDHIEAAERLARRIERRTDEEA